VVHSMDRLARNLDDLRRIVRGLTKRDVRIEFVKEGLTFTGEDSPMANLMLSVMGAFAEFERALIRERQREGIALAKKRGVYRGRKKSPTWATEQAPCCFRFLSEGGIDILRTSRLPSPATWLAGRTGPEAYQVHICPGSSVPFKKAIAKQV
jgi:DNA invertase Pin-like site-specific DNA recombinase